MLVQHVTRAFVPTLFTQKRMRRILNRYSLNLIPAFRIRYYIGRGWVLHPLTYTHLKTSLEAREYIHGWLILYDSMTSLEQKSQFYLSSQQILFKRQANPLNLTSDYVYSSPSFIVDHPSPFLVLVHPFRIVSSQSSSFQLFT